MRGARGRPLVFLAIPFFAYAISYVYLALYHRALNLWPVVVHESGRLTLLQNTFYASHFLGHLPVLVMLSFLFAGWYLSMADSGEPVSVPVRPLALALVIFLGLSFALAFLCFDDTPAFLLQQKQSEAVSGEGGSWNLHLPSSLTMVFFVPLYLAGALKLAGRAVALSRRGALFIIAGIVVLIVMTGAVNTDVVTALAMIWTSPRYMAHSVRELMTFPVTYFPLPLFFLVRQRSHNAERPSSVSRAALAFLMLSLAVCAAGVLYQSSIALSAGIGKIAQKPFFAPEKGLTIGYLLASHYFEHVLDTVFFTLLSVLLCARGAGKDLREGGQWLQS